MGALLDEVLWQMVRARWAVEGVPRAVMLVLDSTVVLRYGLKQAGAERGYNPKKPGRPSHHPLVAFLAETSDCLGVWWRPGSAHTAAGAVAWIERLIVRLKAAGVEEITLRLDKGFFSREMVSVLEALGLRYVLKVPDHSWVRSRLSGYRQSAKDEALWTATGTLYVAQDPDDQRRGDRSLEQEEPALARALFLWCALRIRLTCSGVVDGAAQWSHLQSEWLGEAPAWVRSGGPAAITGGRRPPCSHPRWLIVWCRSNARRSSAIDVPAPDPCSPLVPTGCAPWGRGMAVYWVCRCGLDGTDTPGS